jgi:hypothetical protein
MAYTRPEDYQAALLRMIDAASAVNAEVLDALHHRQIDPVGLSITTREVEMQLSRLRHELSSSTEQMERLLWLCDDLWELYQQAQGQRNLLLAWMIARERGTEP